MGSRVRAHEEELEGYFASISDLMVGILFIFLLMLTVFALNFADEDKDAELRRLRVELDRTSIERDRASMERDQLRIEGAQVRRERDDARSQRDDARARIVALDAELTTLVVRIGAIEEELDTAGERLRNTRADLLRQLQATLVGRGVNVEVSAQQDVLRLPSEELFALGASTFTPRGQERVMAVLDELGRLLPCYALHEAPLASCPAAASPIFETVLIEGHTDAVPADNWRLSTDRARAVLDLIQRQRAALGALRNPSGQPMLGLAGYGDSRLLAGMPGTDARNRRIELRFLLSPAPEQEAQAIRAELEAVKNRLAALRSP